MKHQMVPFYITVVLLLVTAMINARNNLLFPTTMVEDDYYLDNPSCSEYNSSYSPPLWPMNKHLIFSVSQTEGNGAGVVTMSFSNVVKFIGAIQYLRISPLNLRSANIATSAEFDSDYTAEEEVQGNSHYIYQNYSSMFSNDKYASHDNGDCTLNMSVNFTIQSLLSNKNLFHVTEDTDLIRIDVPLYLGYAVRTTQGDRYWQNREYLFTARILINTLVRDDGSKDALNAACSSTVSPGQKGIIFCSYSSNSSLEMSNFDIVIDNGQLVMYPHYYSSYAGRTQVQFRTIDKIESLTQFNARIQASVCVLDDEGACQSRMDYKSEMNFFSFQPGAGEVALIPEAQMIFSTTISKFDSTTHNDTIISKISEFFILVRTKVLKINQRIQPGSDAVRVKLTSPPKYHLPGYPNFPTTNTITTYHEPDFPDGLDPDVLNSPYIHYILKFDNSKERYSRASESPLLFQVQFNLEPQMGSRRRNQESSPHTRLFMSEALRPDCRGNYCLSSMAVHTACPGIPVFLLAIILYWIFF